MKKIRRLCVILIMLLCFTVPVRADALVGGGQQDNPVDYYVIVAASDGGANFRYGAGAEYDKLISEMMPNGTVLHIVGERMSSAGTVWGYTEYQGMWGYVALSQTGPYDPGQAEAAAQAEAEKQAAAQAEAEEQEALRKEAEEQEALRKEAEEQEALKKEAEEQEALRKEAEEQEALKKEAQEQEKLEKEAKEQEEKEKKEKEEKEKEEKEKEEEAEEEQSGMDRAFLMKILVIGIVCLILAATAGFLILYYRKRRLKENKEAEHISENQANPGPDEIFCRYCGKKNNKNNEYCIHCGKKIK